MKENALSKSHLTMLIKVIKIRSTPKCNDFVLHPNPSSHFCVILNTNNQQTGEETLISNCSFLKLDLLVCI